MTDVLATAVSFVTAAGFGGVLGAYFQARFQRRSQIGQHEHELKQKRYLCILILMLAKLDRKTGIAKLGERRPDLKTPADLDHELSTELLNGFVFASSNVLESLADFIHAPSPDSFLRTATAMRADLWGKRMPINGRALVELVRESPSLSDALRS